MVEENSMSESMAFKDYAQGRSKKVKTPWATIIITGVVVGLAYIATEIFAAYVLDNPYALNFILALYGIPAGFVCAMKNKTFAALVSLRYSTFSALISVAVFGAISFIFILASTSDSIGAIVGFVQLVIALAIIAVFSIFVTFAMGAMLGTFIAGVKDARGY